MTQCIFNNSPWSFLFLSLVIFQVCQHYRFKRCFTVYERENIPDLFLSFRYIVNASQSYDAVL
jgi:hypothetical protein